MDWRRSFIHDNTTHIKWSPYLFGSAAAEPDSKSLKWILKGKENKAHVIKFSISSTYLFQFCKRQLFMGFDSSLFNLGVRSPKTIYLKAQESLHQKKDQKKSEFLTGTFQLHFFSPIGKHDMFIIKRYVLRNLFEKFRNHCFSSNTIF